MMRKIDKFLHGKIENFVRRWVSKRKFVKHKYDLALLLKKIEIGVYAFLIAGGTGLALLKKEWMLFGIVLLIGTFFITMDVFDFARINQIKLSYDPLFENRKHPQIHELVKHLCELRFESNFNFRATMLCANTAVILFNSSIHNWTAIIFLTPVYFSRIFRDYLDCVFDFDEPDGHKEAKKELTGVLLEAWDRLVGQVMPAPQGA